MDWLRAAHIGKRNFAESTFVASLCVLVVFLGMRVPNISRPHSPKPHSRAIVENLVKSSQETVKKNLFVVAELTEAVQIIFPSGKTFSPLHKPQDVTRQLTSNSCRAPPFFLSLL